MTRREAVYLLLLALAVLGLYVQFLDNPLVFDDVRLLQADAAGHFPLELRDFFFLEPRSLPYLTFVWSKACWGNIHTLSIWRIENSLLHYAVVVSLFFFVRHLACIVLRQGEAHSALAAFLAALLFAVHPVAVYGVGYLVQRTILMATLFGLLMLLCWAKGLVEGRSSLRWLAVVFYCLAVFSKEHAIMLPWVMVALTMVYFPDWRLRLRQNTLPLLMMLMIAAMVVLARTHIVGDSYEINSPPMLAEVQAPPMLLNALTQSTLFFKYVGLWLLPNPRWMSVDMREPFAQVLLSPYLFGMLGFVLWGVAAFFLMFRRGKAGVLGFAMMFPWLLYFTQFSAVHVQEPFVLYRSYLWASGAWVALPVVLTWMNQKLALALGVVCAVAWTPATLDRLVTFSHPLILWDDAAQRVAGKDHLNGVDRIYYNRGIFHLKAGHYDEAIRDFVHSLQIVPENPNSYLNLGVAFEKKSMWRDAVIAYDQVIRIERDENAEIVYGAYHGRGRALEALGRLSEARKDYEFACLHTRWGCSDLRRLEAKVSSTPADK